MCSCFANGIQPNQLANHHIFPIEIALVSVEICVSALVTSKKIEKSSHSFLFEVCNVAKTMP